MFDGSSIDAHRERINYLDAGLVRYYQQYPQREEWRREATCSGFSDGDVVDWFWPNVSPFNHRVKTEMPEAFAAIGVG